MTRDEILARRWAAQGLAKPQQGGPAATVGRLGALQAQDYAMSLLAIALRTEGGTVAQVEAALDAGSLIRTHVLRPTWHWVAATDLRWMLGLTGPRVAGVEASILRQRGVVPEVLTRSRRVLESALRDGPRTREELVAAFTNEGLPLSENRPSHYLMHAELSLLTCSGRRIAGKLTYDLFDRIVPPSAPVPDDEAAARLVLRYITGHGPAQIRDIVWWSGLAPGTVKRALQANQNALSSGVFEDQEYWFDPTQEPSAPEGLAWLPAFDEWLLAFADRSAAIAPEHAKHWVTKNGMFFPVVVDGGRALGVWKRTPGPKPKVTVEWFDPLATAREAERTAWERRLTALVTA